MTALPALWITSPVIDCEPAPAPLGQQCPVPSGSSLHRIRPHRPAPREAPPPKSAVTFAEAALLQTIEVIDQRRPIAQLRPLMSPALIDRVLVRARAPRSGSATLHRVRVRAVHTGPDEPTAAEVFASFSRSGRVHAIAARIERHRDAWRMVALQIG
ncbi:MAG: Rv3235 family protein [Mycobacterium kyogaense]|uniref:Rv3235 family protein n=1 Tax=Mycobacterium kyogaense TaxID=2212479 RepID=UPI002FF66298